MDPTANRSTRPSGSFLIALLATTAAILLAAAVGVVGGAQAFDSVYCGHGQASGGGFVVTYQTGWTTAGTHYHQYHHWGNGDLGHYATKECGGIGTRPSW